MKRIIICLFSCLLFISLKAQNSAIRIASPEQLSKRDHFGPKLKQLQKGLALSLRANKVSPQGQNFAGVSPNAPAVISPIALGRLSNAYSVIRPEQNQVYANDSLSIVAWIHRQDVTIHGGGATQSGKFRYDNSIDDGFSFNTDIGPLQTIFTHQGGYPNITGFGEEGSNNPFDSELIWCGATSSVPDTGWLGHVYGLMDFFNINPITSTEEYLFDSISTSFPGGLCQGLPGEYWTTDFDEDKDTIWLTKIIVDQNTGNLITSSYLALKPNSNLTLGGASLGPNLSFSPDGMTGYLVWLGDLVGGHDSVLSPCYYKTSDGGISWDFAATEIDLRSVPWLKDSLTTFWIKIDSLTGDTTPAGSGNPTTGFDYDVTVDYHGDLHIGTVIGNSDLVAGPPYYSI